eukprot:scaffold109421_cov26-Tisochrysis_lutea.AAC.1
MPWDKSCFAQCRHSLQRSLNCDGTGRSAKLRMPCLPWNSAYATSGHCHGIVHMQYKCTLSWNSAHAKRADIAAEQCTCKTSRHYHGAVHMQNKQAFPDMVTHLDRCQGAASEGANIMKHVLGHTAALCMEEIREVGQQMEKFKPCTWGHSSSLCGPGGIEKQ